MHPENWLHAIKELMYYTNRDENVAERWLIKSKRFENHHSMEREDLLHSACREVDMQKTYSVSAREKGKISYKRNQIPVVRVPKSAHA